MSTASTSIKNPVLVVGSVALDSVETPFGKADEVLGGSGTYFSSSASLLRVCETRAGTRELRPRCPSKALL